MNAQNVQISVLEMEPESCEALSVKFCSSTVK